MRTGKASHPVRVSLEKSWDTRGEKVQNDALRCRTIAYEVNEVGASRDRNGAG